MDSAPISDAEWDVMEVVWSRGSATAAEIIAELAQTRAWNHRTIRTMLSRLVEKGVLRRTGAQQQSAYEPVLSRDRCVRAESRSFLQKMFGGDAGALLLHFARSSKLSAKEVEELRRILEDKKPEK